MKTFHPFQNDRIETFGSEAEEQEREEEEE